MILQRIDRLKQYPPEARLEQAQGKVVVRLIIHEDGSVSDVTVAKSSGFTSLDQAAVEVLHRAGPFTLPRALGKPSLTVRIPINYTIDRR